MKYLHEEILENVEYKPYTGDKHYKGYLFKHPSINDGEWVHMNDLMTNRPYVDYDRLQACYYKFMTDTDLASCNGFFRVNVRCMTEEGWKIISEIDDELLYYVDELDGDDFYNELIRLAELNENLLIAK